MAVQAMKEPVDPTAETRRLNQIENMMQGGGGDHPLTKRYGAGIAGLEQLIYTTPDALQLIKDATSGSGRAEPFGTPHTSGGTKKISWSPNVSALVQENMAQLEAAARAGQMATSLGPDTPNQLAAYSDIKKGAT